MSQDMSTIPAFFSGLAEALAEGLTVVQAITDNVPSTEDRALRIFTESGTEYLVVFKDGLYFLTRQAAGAPRSERTWHQCYPKLFQPLPGGSVDFGSWKCTRVRKVELIDRNGTSLGWYYQRFPSS